ncbi:Phosphorylated carbohydrates phosphatase [Arthrobacter saudimassiliensis]|uniref:Phosphorylated carbohydrates phosphatase n=1 Tax=Arthrobacter saudimassiliensis TaxID=1461584 RepID=A0A078MLG2_9MICC|nr:Phosphorylated carbohydrates phosphatase [Arthrobacter saudimassiliensis]
MSVTPAAAPFNSTTGLQAVFWDMDGTIVDTEPCWIASEKELVAEFGGTWTDEDAKAMVGQALPVGAGLLQQAGVDLPVRAIIDRMTAQVAEKVRRRVPWRPGARELLADLRARSIPCAMVTMSEPGLADVVAAALPAGTFEFIVTGDQVRSGKPDPEPYLAAMDRMAELVPGLDPQRCIGIEDSLPGVRSARASGLVTLAVPHFVPLPPDLADHTWDTLTGRSAEDLAGLAAAETDAIR